MVAQRKIRVYGEKSYTYSSIEGNRDRDRNKRWNRWCHTDRGVIEPGHGFLQETHKAGFTVFAHGRRFLRSFRMSDDEREIIDGPGPPFQASQVPQPQGTNTTTTTTTEA